MSFEIQFPTDEPGVVVETAAMVRTVRRTMAVHRGGALVVWAGPSRAGKTFTARWMVAKIDEAYETSPHAFRARHYEVGEVPTRSSTGDEMKRGVQSLYTAVAGRMSDGTYKQLTTEGMASLLVHHLVSRNIQMLLVDEAGLLSPKAIRGMVFVRDAAELEGWPLTLVFIGMDDLPLKLAKTAQVKHRIHEWCYFEPYSLAETHALLGALNPHFASLDLTAAADRAQVEFVHRQYGGLPGLIVPFLRRLRYRQLEMTLPLGLDVLRAVHLLTDRDEQRALRDAARPFVALLQPDATPPAPPDGPRVTARGSTHPRGAGRPAARRTEPRHGTSRPDAPPARGGAPADPRAGGAGRRGTGA